MPGFKAVDEWVFRSSMPILHQDIDFLAERGVGVIVSLAELNNQQREEAEKKGMKVLTFARVWGGSKEIFFRRFFNELDLAKKSGIKILVHCGAGVNRTTDFVYEYLRYKDSYSKGNHVANKPMGRRAKIGLRRRLP